MFRDNYPRSYSKALIELPVAFKVCFSACLSFT
uniref:Uncharacterized protein n=1 Tax=Enterococcus phage PMBT56 TaxID=3229530 RepID=A0AB39C695_9CAUD